MHSAEALPFYSRISIGQLIEDSGLNIQPVALYRSTYGQQYGIGVPNGEVARSGAEAETVAKKIGALFFIFLEIGYKDAYITQEVRTWLSKLKFSQADEGRDTLTMGGKEVCVSFTRRMPFASTLRDHENANQIISTARERPKWLRIR